MILSFELLTVPITNISTQTISNVRNMNNQTADINEADINPLILYKTIHILFGERNYFSFNITLHVTYNLRGFS